MPDQPIGNSKTPGILIVSSAVVIFPRKEVDGTFHLPGEEEVLAAMRNANERGIKELLRGIEGNVLVMVGYTGEGIVSTPNPNPPPPEPAPWWAALKKGDKIISLTPINKIPLYNRAGGEIVSQRAISYDMDVFSVTPDPRIHSRAWIQVSESPSFWVQSELVKLKT